MQGFPQRRRCDAGQKPADDYHHNGRSVCVVGLYVSLWATMDHIEEQRRASGKDSLGQGPVPLPAVARMVEESLPRLYEASQECELPSHWLSILGCRREYSRSHCAWRHLFRRDSGRGGPPEESRCDYYRLCLYDKKDVSHHNSGDG